MQIYVNGDLTDIQQDSLGKVIEALGYERHKVVVAVNETFVPRLEWSLRKLSEQDRVEVLSAIQGG